MTNQSERLITLKSGLDERELHILNIELDRRRKSVGVTYGLWFFLSWLGIHKFYLGRIATGVIYVVAPWVLILVFAVGFVMAESNPEAGGATSMLEPARLACLRCMVGRGFVHDPEAGKRLQRKPGTRDHRFAEREENRSRVYRRIPRGRNKKRRLTSARISCPDSPPR